MRMISFRLAIALSIIVAVITVSVAAYYARQLSTTTTIKISPQENTSMLVSATTSIEAPENGRKNILMRISDWAIIIALYSNGTGILRVEYVGEKPLTVENPLLPLTAGLNIALEYSDPSKNTVLRSLGTYYYNASVTIEYGNYSQVKFDSRNLTSIRIDGKILGQIPVRIHIPLTVANCVYENVKTVTVTITKATSSQTTTTPKATCKLEPIGEYPEPQQTFLRKEIEGNQIVYTDNVMKIRVPLEVYSMRIPLTITNKAYTPLVLNKWYFEYEVINISFDGEHYMQVNKKIAYAVPTTTPPWIMDCARTDGSIRLWGRSDVLMPNQTTTLTLGIPDDILGNHDEAWIYVRTSLEYWGVKQLFQVLLNDTVWKYSWATKMYEKTNELNIVFKTHIVKG